MEEIVLSDTIFIAMAAAMLPKAIEYLVSPFFRECKGKEIENVIIGIVFTYVSLQTILAIV